MAVVLAVDAGTTGVRSVAVDPAGTVVDQSYRELPAAFPRPAWVEQDPDEIWRLAAETLAEGAASQAAVAVGITNQRETVVAWDRRTGRPRHAALVWQDRRTAGRCRALEEAGHQAAVRNRTGLVLDPYFSATKMRWLLDHGVGDPADGLAMGTVDSWLLWRLTGGPRGGVLATEPSNASRTLLYDLAAGRWSEELADLFGVPLDALAEIRPSAGRFGRIAPDALPGGALAGVAVSGVLGDQQAALFGQACLEPGMAKVTYGTGSFVLVHAGPRPPEPPDGLLVTAAWDLGTAAGDAERLAYALEGSAFVSGAAIGWLRDGLGIIGSAAEVGPLAASVPDSGGVTVVPAFTGLGSPWWDPEARGVVTGLTRGAGRAQLARAVVEAMAFQVRDMVEAMAGAGCPVGRLRADGGAAVMDLLLQLQADHCRVPVARPPSVESTARGAATLAGLAEGLWGSLDELAALWVAEAEWRPEADRVVVDQAHLQWRRAVERARHWARSEGG
jgi:glycerol kinase